MLKHSIIFISFLLSLNEKSFLFGVIVVAFFFFVVKFFFYLYFKIYFIFIKNFTIALINFNNHFEMVYAAGTAPFGISGGSSAKTVCSFRCGDTSTGFTSNVS